ncbi:MAG: carbon storage regulator CsrA [Planctomycetes bacterium]|nr:carbon storage regulator CsrA [Planctomycetota bacterium]MBL7037852.1 carbon storage regulator CsrA [Pirellulaceae bacterium]
MLVLSRKVSERVQIGDGIEVTVLRICGGIVRLGFTAPPDVQIHREEIYRKIASKDGKGPREDAEAIDKFK